MVLRGYRLQGTDLTGITQEIKKISMSVNKIRARTYAKLLGCPDRSGCGFHLGTNVCKHELTEDEVRQILVDGRTANYISFVSKKGNKFRAAIVLDRDSKQTKFETEEW